MVSVLLWILDLVYFWPQVVRGKALYWGDIGLYFSPMLSFLHEQLRTGRIPLWNPWILCGAPYIGNPQTWPLYPFSIFLRWMSVPAFLNWTVAFHIWFTALGTFCFVRHGLGRAVLPAFLAGLVFAFGGEMVSKEQFPNMVQAAAYLPWVLLMTHRLIVANRGREALWLGVTLGLQLLAAHAQMLLLTLYLSAAYGIRLLVLGGRLEPSTWRRLAGNVLLSGAVAAGLAAGQVCPTAELYRDAWRQRLSFSVVDRFYLPGNQMSNFVLPNLHGHPMQGDFTARGNFWETCCFVGWIAFALASLGVLTAFRRTASGQERFWSGVALVGFLLALGGQTWHGGHASNGLYWLAYQVLPGFRNFHDPARCLLWVSFALAVLAAFGLERLEGAWTARPAFRLTWVVLIGVCFAELMHFGRRLYPLADPATLSPVSPLVERLRSDPSFQAHQARFLAPDSTRVWQRFTSHQSYRQTAPDYQRLWADTLTPNLMMTYGLPDAYGYEPVARLDTQTITGTAVQSFGATAKPRERAGAATWAGFLSVLAITSLRVHAPESEVTGLSPVVTETTLPPMKNEANPARIFLSRNERWQPRARLMSDFRAIKTPPEALSLMTNSLLHPDTLDLNTTVVLTGRVSFPPRTGRPVAAKIVGDDPDHVGIVAVTSAPSILVLADTRHPGWKVRVNGKPASLLTADACLRAVPLPQAGRYAVIFTDHPTSFLFGLYLSFLTVGALAGVATFAFITARKNNEWRQESETGISY